MAAEEGTGMDWTGADWNGVAAGDWKGLERMGRERQIRIADDCQVMAWQ